MKTIKIVLFTLLFAGVQPLLMAQNTDVPSEIIAALNQGDGAKLSSYFNNNVELAIGNKNDVFSKQQAAGIVVDFFRVNKVLSFKLLHQGNKEAASFAIGEIKTNNTNYRVYILTRKSGNQIIIQQLRIEPQND